MSPTTVPWRSNCRYLPSRRFALIKSDKHMSLILSLFPVLGAASFPTAPANRRYQSVSKPTVLFCVFTWRREQRATAGSRKSKTKRQLVRTQTGNHTG